jgi:hypothetical protein
MWLNDTRGLALEGDTNRDVHDPSTGACIDDPLNLTCHGTKDGPHGDDRYRIYVGPFSQWPAGAQKVIGAAGRRADFPLPLAPPVSPQKTPGAKPPLDCAPPPGESKRLVVESPWSQLTSECQRF